MASDVSEIKVNWLYKPVLQYRRWIAESQNGRLKTSNQGFQTAFLTFSASEFRLQPQPCGTAGFVDAQGLRAGGWVAAPADEFGIGFVEHVVYAGLQGGVFAEFPAGIEREYAEAGRGADVLTDDIALTFAVTVLLGYDAP